MYEIKNLAEKTLNKDLLEEFLGFANNKLGINQPYSVYFVDDKQNAADPLGKTAMYNPSSNSVYVYATNRHPKDILRSIAHELMHHKQNCDGRLDKTYGEGSTSEKQLELEANKAGYLVREFEDGIKSKSLKEEDVVGLAEPVNQTGAPASYNYKEVFINRWWQKWQKGELPFIKLGDKDDPEINFRDWVQDAWETHKAMMKARGIQKEDESYAWTQILDYVGIIPGVGEAADLLSAGIKYDYALRVQERKGLDAATPYYIDAAISLFAATLAGETFKIIGMGIKKIAQFGTFVGVKALAKVLKVEDEIVLQTLKDSLLILKRKLGARAGRLREATDRLIRQLDETANNLKRLRSVNVNLSIFLKNIDKMTMDQLFDMLLENKATREKFQKMLKISFGPLMAELVAQRRLKYFYDLPNTKDALNSIEFAEEVAEKLGLPLDPFKEILKNATEKEADDIYALLDFLLNTNKRGSTVGPIVSDFGSQALNAKSSKELAKYAKDTYIRDFSTIFEKMVGVEKRAISLFKEVLNEAGFKDIFAELAKKRSDDLAKKIAKIESGELGVNSAGLEEILSQSNPSKIIDNIFREKEFRDAIRLAASELTMSYANKGSVSKLIDKITFDFFPAIGKAGGAAVKLSAPVIQKNILGRRYLTDGAPVNYGGILVGRTLARFFQVFSYLPIVGWLFIPFRFRSARQAIEAAVAATIASAITYNRFFKVIYPEAPGGSGTKGKGGKSSISAGQQAAADEAAQGVEDSIQYIVRSGKKYRIVGSTEVDSKSFESPNVKEEVKKVEDKIEKSNLPPEVKAEVRKTLGKIKENPEELRKIAREEQAKAGKNIAALEEKTNKNPEPAPKGMPDKKGTAPSDPGGGTRGAGDTGSGKTSGTGTGTGEGFGPGSDRKVLYVRIKDAVNNNKYKSVESVMDKEVFEKLKKFGNTRVYLKVRNKINYLKRKVTLDDFKNEPFEQMEESINNLADYREKVLNERFDKLVKGFVK